MSSAQPGKKLRAPRRRPWSQWFGRALPILLLGVALIGAPAMILSSEGMPRLEAVEKELTTVEHENRQLERDIEVLRAQVAKLRDDPAAVERLARDELGLIRQTEVVFQFAE
ncbi:MAG: septum formation initiator family protein [Myxococcota bacterium]